MKQVWVTSLVTDNALLAQLFASLKPYHLTIDGHFLSAVQANGAGHNVAKAKLLNKNTSLWLLVVNRASLADKALVKELGLLLAVVSSLRQSELEIVVLTTDHDLEPLPLPAFLQNKLVLNWQSAGLGAKLTAKLHLPQARTQVAYRLNWHNLDKFGLWLEVGPPPATSWTGIIVGVSGATIDFQAYGPSGELPQKCSLEYPEQGFKLNYQDQEFMGWAIRNQIDGQSSYFARVNQLPDQILFGSYPTGDQFDAFVVNLMPAAAAASS